jgi:hypothetical protein
LIGFSEVSIEYLRGWKNNRGKLVFTKVCSGCVQVMWPVKWLTCGLNRTPVHLRRSEFIRRRPMMRLESEPFMALNIEYPIQQSNLS